MKKETILINTFAVSLFSLTSFSMTTLADIADSKNTTASFKLVAPTNGTLKITKATDITFNDATISATDIVTTNSSDTQISIQELSGDAPGWKLSAKLGEFKGTTKGKTLSGATLFYPSVTPTTTNASDTSSILPESINTDMAFSGSQKGKIITAGEDGATIVMAETKKGYGSWTMSYKTGQIQLNIPAGNLKDNYTADLTYTLVDSPN